MNSASAQINLFSTLYCKGHLLILSNKKNQTSFLSNQQFQFKSRKAGFVLQMQNLTKVNTEHFGAEYINHFNHDVIKFVKN